MDLWGIPQSLLAGLGYINQHLGIPSDFQPATPIGQVAKSMSQGQGDMALAVAGGPKLAGRIPPATAPIFPPIVQFRQEAARIAEALPPAQEGLVRLWRGNRPNEIGSATQFTNDLPGIALPFSKSYGGKVSYVDVPAADLPKYLNSAGAATNAEFNLPAQLARNAKQAPIFE